jgi:hypothetical protein
MRKHPTATPALPTAERATPHSSVTTKVEDRAKQKEMLDELLRQVIAEAKAFRRPAMARTPRTPSR